MIDTPLGVNTYLIFIQGMELAGKSVEKLVKLNRRTMDQLAARIYFYHARFYELTDRLAEIRP